ncbi:phosphoribosylpyrophosphate synthetase [Candidatus Falkowbacteria bacterium RIFOXYB2_FULL_47_14]|uniref:Ribose-phosphate pyrophosphokinase n=1 Tax=Candidatus Falkowbacteria bacterium RIFOXYA2_FULL_47_19 TaxID=1797994 RepID=A0A1F5SGJ5_9BACT|nr:MAG: phosphoribosylpyrophosphate synthetase [Candidatus Falkowbacteria bacterium RIFOXYA2_FULL_47_19]OGF35013.1 MAG: phosphoribosylpyrophosphate synthetase [Candidatus Falkowbacteria bacterium RIFOXYC2_FULL_46_15]OGF43731.1 MAG: phosphoribosylpyrophosphate synthetase [Candidatus Falkowbacteria bacterium RIFOXYB2_FULL_47_14]
MVDSLKKEVEELKSRRGANNGFSVFLGNSNKPLGKKICSYLKKQISNAKVTTFSDNEVQIEIKENVRQKDVYVIQSICSDDNRSVNDYLTELLLMISTFKRASAGRITAVIPYYGYARQDKKVAPRVPISARDTADLLQTAGAGKIITMDLHSPQIQGFFNIPVDHLWARPVLVNYLGRKFSAEIERGELTIVAPDVGRASVDEAYAERLRAGLAIIYKRREQPNEVKTMRLLGNVRDKIVVILDDMVDTAGTITAAGELVMSEGAREVYACGIHPVLSGPAVKRIEKSVFKSVIVTDTVNLNSDAQACDKFEVVSIAETFGEAIIRCHRGDSVTSLFL